MFVHDYARLLKSNFPTIDAAEPRNGYQKHLFQMTVSPSHSVNLAQPGLTRAMTELGWIGGGGAAAASDSAAQPCVLYLAVPPDVYPVYQHKGGSVVPLGSSSTSALSLPANVTLSVVEIPLRLPGSAVQPQLDARPALSLPAAAAAAALGPGGAGSKRKAEDADTIEPSRTAKKTVDTKCN